MQYGKLGLLHSQIMNDASAVQKAALQKQSPGIGHTLVPSRHVCFYKSGDAQFSGLPVIINNRTFKTFEALLDSLSKRIPLPFGVRTITTPRGHTTVHALNELHHGHSYICSDKRIVKPIDLEQARRRPPPWYHARPVSSKHLRERQSPHHHNTRRTEHTALLNTPKRLVVFRNGDPEVKHTLLLHKRSTHSFEALLDHISEIMRFPVRRLHTPDGRRVDGLPALILCSGVLVAAGHEPFRKGNYYVQKPFAPTWLPAKSVEKVNPVTKSACDNTGSVEMDTGHQLESVAETDTISCMDGNKNEYVCMPKDDDIEKSFRVNQDGSMTVEMKVRLTIKEEETVHWTTTLSRQNATSQMKVGLETHSDLGAALTEKNAPDVDTDAPAIHRWPEEYSSRIKEHLKLIPKQKQISVKTESQETEQNVDTLTEIANSEQEHILPSAPGKWNRHPVPKPHSANITQMQAGMYKSAEVLQIHDSGQETMLHIYQKQICQKGFLANTEFVIQEIPTYDAVFSASSNSVPSSSKNLKFMQRPATAYSSLQKQKNVPLSKPNASCEGIGPSEIKTTKPKAHASLSESLKISACRMILTADTSKKNKKVRVVLKKNYIVYIMTRENRGNKIYILKKRKNAMCEQTRKKKGVKEQYKTKSTKASLKSKRNYLPKNVQMQIQGVDELHVKEHQTSAEHHAKTWEPGENQKKQAPSTIQNKKVCSVATDKGSPTQQTSMQEDQETQMQEIQKLLESNSLPSLHYTSSVLNEYVELRLQTSEKEPPPDQKQMPPSRLTEKLLINCDKISPHISLDRMSVKKTFSFPKRASAHEGSSLSRFNTWTGDIKLSQINPSVNMHLPMKKKNHLEKITLNDNILPSKGFVCQSINNSILHETNYAVLDKSSATSSKQEIIKPSQSVTKDKNSDDFLGNALTCANFYIKPTPPPREPSSEKTLSTQHSIEQIPQNNTLSKASLFKNYGPLGMTEEAIIEQKLVDLCEKDKRFYSRPLSKKEFLPALKSYTVKMAVRPDMKHVLDKLCHSIYSLREAILHKQLSCLEKSKSMPDLFSHLASTFGSSSLVFLPFLSVMTLRNGLENINALHQVNNNQSFSEALLMLQSLKKMAAIEDADKLRVSLDALLKSASDQLLKNWKGFQDLSDMCISFHVMSECTRDRSYSVSSSEEEAVQRLMEELGVPDRVREELTAFHTQTKENVRCNQVETIKEQCASVNRYTESSLDEDKTKFSDCMIEDINTFVKYVIEKAVTAHINSDLIVSHSLLGTEKDFEVISCKKKENSNLFDNIFREKQIEDKDIIPEGNMKTHGKQKIIKKEMKDCAVYEQSEVTQRVVAKDDCVERNYIMATHFIYSDKEMKKKEKIRVTSKKYKNNKESMRISSEKEKYSLEEDPDEHAKVDLVNDKEENLKINSQAELQAKWQNQELVTESCTQLNHKSKSVKKTGHPILQNTLLTVQIKRRAQDQTKKMFSKKQHSVVETPEPVHQENIDERMNYSLKEAVVCERKTIQAKIKNGSVATLISNLETCTQNSSSKPIKQVHVFVGHTEVSDQNPGILHNISSSCKLTDTTLEANLSSLAFSYDSQSSSVAHESERNIQASRVKYIRDMFLAKSQTKTGDRQLHIPNFDLADSQPVSRDSEVNQSQETSSGEDETSRLAIAKGFVRRTIERLYGRSNSSGIGAENIQSLSILKAKEIEGLERPSVSSLASYHEACTRETDLSYFSATNTSDIFNVPTDCVTLNKQVQCEDANAIDKENWLFVRNQTDESASKLRDGQTNGNNQISFISEKPPGQEDFIQPCTKLKQCPGSPGLKFTYFNLPNASDSELEPEEKIKVSPKTEPHKTLAERNSFLLVFNPPVLKKSDNKVHPLMNGATVVNQPIKRQGALTEVIKSTEEPDALEMLFVFCGQHCPIL